MINSSTAPNTTRTLIDKPKVEYYSYFRDTVRETFAANAPRSTIESFQPRNVVYLIPSNNDFPWGDRLLRKQYKLGKRIYIEAFYDGLETRSCDNNLFRECFLIASVKVRISK